MASIPAARQAAHAPPATAAHNAPPGTFMPGTKVQVGTHRVVIEKYLSEGGFAHVYVVRVPTANGSYETAVLKRVAVPGKEELANMRTEVETMKKLKGHKHIVTYIDSHASQLKGGGYEVFLLMEYCIGGGLIDFMNTRLKNRLTEPEILNIISDVAEGVACMHYLKPPLLHRDLKVENVLISTTSSGSKLYKLCDFGSTAPPRPAATTAAEGRLIEDDVQRHTTLQYRSPEMIDVYRKQPIDEKSDIWALGVLLYKLCYYTTPFEAQGQMAILTASFKYPPHPVFSDQLKLLIASMLSEQPQRRPNVYQVLKQVCSMRGVSVPIKDIYAHRTPSEARNSQQLPPREIDIKSPPTVGAHYAPPEKVTQVIPEVTPMRRGRPTSSNPMQRVGKPSPSPGAQIGGDPFAALDSKNYATRSAAVDELGAKYPSLDEFSLLQNKGSKFQFDANSPRSKGVESLNQRVTNALADEAFGTSNPPMTTSSVSPSVNQNLARNGSLRKSRVSDSTGPNSSHSQSTFKPVVEKSGMVSIGTMTSRPPSPVAKPRDVSEKPIFRVPNPENSNPYIRQSRTETLKTSVADNRELRSSSAGDIAPRSSSRAPLSSRTSLENLRPTHLEPGETLHRSKSTESHPRVKSEATSSLPTHSHSLHIPRHLRPHRHSRHDAEKEPANANGEHEAVNEDSSITSSVDFLRQMEAEEAAAKGHHRRTSSTLKHIKHASLPSMGFTGGRNILSGRLGDKFKRYESNVSGLRSSSPDSSLERESDKFTSETQSGTGIDILVDDNAIDETEDLSPEVRREIERRRLSQEERRVAQAAAVYRQQVSEDASTGGRRKANGGSSRATAIQDRVKNLLDESGRTSPVKRTAEGYGRYTESSSTPPPTATQTQMSAPNVRKPLPQVPTRKPQTLNSGFPLSTSPSTSTTIEQQPSSLSQHQQQQQVHQPSPSTNQQHGLSQQSTNPYQKATIRPTAPPKPQKPTSLRTGSGGNGNSDSMPSTKPIPITANTATLSHDDGDNWESNFSKRYPSLSLEMVETEIIKADRRAQAVPQSQSQLQSQRQTPTPTPTQTQTQRPVGLRVKEL